VTAAGPQELAGEAGFAVIDVETTGFSPGRDRIVELAVVLVGVDGREQGAFATLLDPGCDPGPTHVHGITPGQLVGAPTFDEVQPYLAALLSGRVVVGHNVARFDLAFVREECRRTGGDALVVGEVPLVDTMTVGRDRLGLYGRAKLVDCCDHFGITWEDHHSALGDARATASLCAAMRGTLGDGSLGIPDLLVRAQAIRWPGADPGRRVVARPRA
jgi:DNA polymerase-3 subunit epsilon